MTGFNHAATGGLIAVVAGNALIAIPLAFVSHFVLDAIPHFGWFYSGDVFDRNKRREFQVGFVIDLLLSLFVIIYLPIFMRPVVSWWVALASIIAAIFMDLIWVYRGTREVFTKIEKPRNRIMNFHLNISRHHSRLVAGLFFELAWFIAALGLIIRLVNSR
jgi:hypothetical protein